MKRNTLMEYDLAALMVSVALLCAINPAQAADKKPNILVIWGDNWKATFAGLHGNIITGVRLSQNTPLLVNLRADPYEIMPEHSEMYPSWFFDNIWVFPMVGRKIQAFQGMIPQYPFQEGLQLNPAGVNYNSLKVAGVLRQLQSMQQLMGDPNN